MKTIATTMCLGIAFLFAAQASLADCNPWVDAIVADVPGFLTGNSLETLTNQSFLAYVIGVYDSNRLSGCYCAMALPITTGQLGGVVRKWMKENPEQLHRAADWIVVEALTQAFPCAPKR